MASAHKSKAAVVAHDHDDDDDDDYSDDDDEDTVEEADARDEDVDALESRAVKLLKSASRGKESTDALADLMVLCATSPTRVSLRNESVKLLYSILSEPQQGPFRLRLLCAQTLQTAAPSSVLTFANFDPPVDRKQLPWIFPLLIAKAPQSVVDPHLPLLVRSSVAAEQDVRVASFCALVAFANEYGRPAVPLEGIDVQTRELLRNASTVSAAGPASSSSFWKRPSTAVPCTEIDGSPLKEFFTALCHSQAYTPDQVLNVYTFSFLRSWLGQVFMSDVSSSKAIDPDLEEVVVKYCVRIFEQADALWNPGNADYRFHQTSVVQALKFAQTIPNGDVDYMAVESAAVEAVYVLETLCRIDTTLVTRLMPMMKRLYNKNVSLPSPHGPFFIALAQFFASHALSVSYDADPIYATLFQNFISGHYADPLIAYEIMRLCISSQNVLGKQSKTFDRYFPSIVKLVAWHPQTLSDDFLSILPLLVKPGSFIELFHSLIDLPVIAAALEHLSRNKDFLNISPDLPPEQLVIASANRALFNYVLRSESGIGNYNFWSSTTWRLLMDFYNQIQPLSPRIHCCATLVPHVLTAFTEVALNKLNEADLEMLIPVIFERIAQIFPIASLKVSATRSLMDLLLAIVSRYPHLVLSSRRLFLDFLSARSNSEGKEELLLHIAWLVGTYATPMVDSSLAGEVLFEFYEAFELLAYETNMLVASAANERLYDAGLNESLGRQVKHAVSAADDASLSTRMLLTLISTLAKLAARSPDLIPRALLCISKVVKSQQKYSGHADRTLLQRANELSRLLRMPSIASAILDPHIASSQHSAVPPSSTSGHVDRNSSLPFLLFPAHDDPRRDDLFAEGVPHKQWPALHPFML